MSMGFYEILQVSPDASQEAIARAWQEQVAIVVRKLRAAEARNQDTAPLEARRAALTEAHNVLFEPSRRARYDRFRELAQGTLPTDAEELWKAAGPSMVPPSLALSVELVRTLSGLRVGESLLPPPSREGRAGREPAYEPTRGVRLATAEPTDASPTSPTSPLSPTLAGAPTHPGPAAYTSAAVIPGPAAYTGAAGFPGPAAGEDTHPGLADPPSQPPRVPRPAPTPGLRVVEPRVEYSEDTGPVWVPQGASVQGGSAPAGVSLSPPAPTANAPVPAGMPIHGAPANGVPSGTVTITGSVQTGPIGQPQERRRPGVAPASPNARLISSEDLARMLDQYGPTGAWLKRVRESRGLPLTELSATTRISQRYLDAMERDAYAELPAATFVRGYLKTTLRALDVLQGGQEKDEFIEGYMSRLLRAKG